MKKSLRMSGDGIDGVDNSFVFSYDTAPEVILINADAVVLGDFDETKNDLASAKDVTFNKIEETKEKSFKGFKN